MLHFTPEHFFTDFFKNRVGHYATADIAMPGVDSKVDLRKLPFPEASFDFVYASHVLEHIDEDAKAIAEISRIPLRNIMFGPRVLTISIGTIPISKRCKSTTLQIFRKSTSVLFMKIEASGRRLNVRYYPLWRVVGTRTWYRFALSRRPRDKISR